MKKSVFIDFDGTITKIDTCAAMVETFAGDGWQELNKLWEEKKLSTADCAKMIFKLFNTTPEEIKNLMDTIEIDEYFKEFISLCGSKDYEVYILSDGYDFNIQSILSRHDINLKYYANRLLYESGKGFGIECPYENITCKNCGTCKTSLINKLKNVGDQVIYIGDSYSDMCPAALADVVFAKDVLFRYCREKGLNAVCFTNFGDIISSGLI